MIALESNSVPEFDGPALSAEAVLTPAPNPAPVAAPITDELPTSW